MQTFHDYLRTDLGQLLMLTFAATVAIQGLIAIWATNARTHWFLRALAVWGGVMLLVAIRAYEPAAIFACAAPLTMIGIPAANWAASRLPRIHAAGAPTIHDVLPLAMPEVGVMTCMLASLVLAAETILQGHWWFDPMAFAAWGVVLLAIGATIYDLSAAGGRATHERWLALRRLATIGLRWASISLNDQLLLPASAEITPAARPKWRFTLRDLFYAMLLVALIIVGFQAMQHGYTWQDWLAFATWGALVAAVVTLAYGCAVSRWRLLLAPLLILAVIVAGRLTPQLCNPFITEKFTIAVGQSSRWSGAQRQMATAIVYAEAALLMMMITALSCLAHANFATSAARKASRLSLAGFFLAGGIYFAWLYWQMFWITPIPPAFAGGTTHYSRIVEIVSHADRNWWSPTSPSKPWVPPVVGDKQQLIAELADLTRAANYIPFVVEERQFSNHDFEPLRRASDHFRSFCQVLDAEAAAASSQADDARAVELCLVIIRLGAMLQRGGLNTDNGQGCQSLAYKRLTELRSRLEPATLRTILTTLLQAADAAEDPAIVYARGQAFGERAVGWTERLQNIFHNHGWRYVDPYIATQQNLLQTDLAITLFHQDHNRWPSSLDELVSKYLSTIPLDPLAAMPIGQGYYLGKVQRLCYRLDHDTYLLYSVGAFGQDNGGNFTTEHDALHTSTYDVDLETWLRP